MEAFHTKPLFEPDKLYTPAEIKAEMMKLETVRRELTEAIQSIIKPVAKADAKTLYKIIKLRYARKRSQERVKGTDRKVNGYKFTLKEEVSSCSQETAEDVHLFSGEDRDSSSRVLMSSRAPYINNILSDVSARS